MDAIDDLSDALETTRNFLTPVSLGLWVKLAIVVFFVSSLGMGGPTIPGGDVGTFADEPMFEEETPGEVEEFEEEFPLEELLLVLLVVGGIVLLLWLLYAIISAVMQFVFIESLRSTEVHVRRYFKTNLGNGLRLFLFRVGLLLVAGVLGTAPALAIWLQGGFDALSGALVALYALYGIGLFLVYSLTRRFTDEFVAPVMLLEDRGVLGGWRRFWSTLTGNWTEYLVYLILVWILSLAVTIAVWFVLAFGVLALLIPFAIVIFLLILAAGEIGAILSVLVGIVAFLTILLFVALVWTPITTYFQYYALLLLGDTNDDLDLIPEQRAAVRSDGGKPVGRNGTQAGDARDDRDRLDRDERRATDDGREWDDDSDPWSDADETDDPDPWDDSSESDDRDDDRGW
ncbi:DUF7544 domain-containing protein [Natronorubrum tibetense]|uniref:Glycerophosphoryl diester phosphodiesterase membrane domain-containing protein n=1 Tax=Natronorubrum tibetense GA33 TaxID=1114856 RepID=L9VLZ6_9EURY|nr:hypothetical protein [Natronorubrum tibetense]ELY37283.1 hypothetical protein C496_20650 [Natronorubrum tibetense GA33]